MSFLNLRFGVPRESDLMITEQECSNWGLDLLLGKTTTLLNLSSEENNTFIGWLGVPLHTFSHDPKNWASQTEHETLDGLHLQSYSFWKKHESEADDQAASWPIGWLIHITKHSTICWLHCVTQSLHSFYVFSTCSLIYYVLWLRRW